MKIMVLVLSLLILFLGGTINAQVMPFTNGNNVVQFGLYGGYWTETSQDGNYEGMYISTLPYKSGSFAAGAFASFNRSDYKNYIIGANKGSNFSFDGGISIGYWFNLSASSGLWSGLNLGLKVSSSENSSYKGLWESQQDDQSFIVNINLTMKRQVKIFPKISGYLYYQDPVNTKKYAAWNREVVDVPAWDNTNLDIQIKPVIYTPWLGLGYKLTPKLVLGFENHGLHELQDIGYPIGLDIGVNRFDGDDMVSAFLIAKTRPEKEPQWSMGLIINFLF